MDHGIQREGGRRRKRERENIIKYIKSIILKMASFVYVMYECDTVTISVYHKII